MKDIVVLKYWNMANLHFYLFKCFIILVCPESIQPCTMKNRDIYWWRKKTQETLHIGQWCLSPLQSCDLLEDIWFIGSRLNQVISNSSNDVPSALVAEAAEWVLPQHVSCQDPVSQFGTQSCLEPPDQPPALALSAAGLCWWRPVHSSTSSGVLLVAGLPERGSLSADFRSSLKHRFVEKLCSTKAFPGTKNVGDHCFRGNTLKIFRIGFSKLNSRGLVISVFHL